MITYKVTPDSFNNIGTVPITQAEFDKKSLELDMVIQQIAQDAYTKSMEVNQKEKHLRLARYKITDMEKVE